MTDAEIIRQVRAGETEAYSQLVRRYQNIVYGLAYHHVRAFEDARDIAQEAFLQAYINLDRLREPEKFGPWLRQITVNECRAWRRRRRPEETLEGIAGAIDQTQQIANRLFVQQALESLSEPSRLTVTLFYFHSFSLNEIAEFLSEPVTTIKSRLRNARARLQKEMQSMVEETFKQEALPEDFAERVIQIIEAARKGDLAKIQQLLSEEPTLATATDTNKSTALHSAAAAGWKAVVELLIAHGADVNALDEGDNASPLHFAAERGHLDVVKVLVEHGADVNWNQDWHERGPLGWAVVFADVHTDVAEYLIEKGARLDLFSAIAMGRADVVRELVAADPGATDKLFDRYCRPIPFAVMKGQPEIAQLMADLGANLDIEDAVALGRTDLVREFLKRGLSPDDLCKGLHTAVISGPPEIVRLILEAGADPYCRRNENRTPIFFAVERKDSDIAKILIAHGAGIEAKDESWNSTALGWQVFFGHPDEVEFALTIGAKATDGFLKTAEQGERGELRAWSNGRPEGFRRVAELLRQYGAK